MRNDNRVIVDLNKAQYVKLYYMNQHGDRSNTILQHSVHGQVYDPEAPAMPWRDMPPETMEQRAVRCKLKDVWHPVLHVKLTANGYLIYHDAKALSIYKEWCSRIFNKTKKK